MKMKEMGNSDRDDYVKKLQSIYEERQKLNMEAIRVLLPQVGPEAPPSIAVTLHEYIDPWNNIAP